MSVLMSVRSTRLRAAKFTPLGAQDGWKAKKKKCIMFTIYKVPKNAYTCVRTKPPQLSICDSLVEENTDRGHTDG